MKNTLKFLVTAMVFQTLSAQEPVTGLHINQENKVWDQAVPCSVPALPNVDYDKFAKKGLSLVNKNELARKTTIENGLVIIDLVLFYSHKNVEKLGEKASKDRLIEGLKLTNEGLENSGATFRFRMVGLEKLQTPANWATLDDAVSQLRNYEPAQSRREALGADAVYYEGTEKGCGLAWRNERPSKFKMVGTGSLSCGTTVMRHELGHNMGLRHGISDANHSGGINIGWSPEKTIMGGNSIPYFSTPTRVSPKTGNRIGISGKIDAVTFMNSIAATVSAFFETKVTPEPTTPTVPTTPTTPQTGNDTYTIRAKGITGKEQIRLVVGDKILNTFTLSTDFANYQAKSSEKGAIKVEFFNDAGDLDVEVDYLNKNETKYQSENQQVNTSVWQNDNCGGTLSAMMHCNGYIEFSNATTTVTPPITPTVPVTTQLITDGQYRIKSNANGEIIASTRWSNWKAVEINEANYDDQKWNFKHLGNNVYVISLVANGRNLEVPSGKRLNGTLVVATTYPAIEDHIKWKISKIGDNYFFKPNHDLSKAMDIRPSDNSIHIWSYSANNKNQHWDIAPVQGRKGAVERTEIIISPNPVSDRLQVQGVKKGDLVQIYDLQGRLVFKTVIDQIVIALDIDVQHLNSGLYIAKVGTEEIRSMQFVKK